MDLTIFERDTALVTLLKQMTDAVFNSRVSRHRFQTAEIAAMAALAERIDLDMTDLTDVAVTANENSPVRDNSGTGSPVYPHQNGVFTVLTRTKIVLSKRQTTNIMADVTGNVETLFERAHQAPVFNLNVRHITNDAGFGIHEPWQNDRDGN
ncbi:hypothetical protein D3C80_1684380 [compost metagenome]